MLSSPLLPLFLIILLNTLILIYSSAKANKNVKIQSSMQNLWHSGNKYNLLCLFFFLDQFFPLQKTPWYIQSKQWEIMYAINWLIFIPLSTWFLF